MKTAHTVLLLVLCHSVHKSIGNFAETILNATSTDRSGLVGAVLGEDLIYKKAIACQGQKLYIACSNIYYRIQVQSTFYGREDATTCKDPELPSDKICAEQNSTVKTVVMDLCQGEPKCEVAATNDLLAQWGTIICPNVYKYLYVKYRCVPKTSLPESSTLPQTDHSASSVVSTVTSHYAPVQCCYVVPSASQYATTSVGGPIVRHREGVQSVEERIVSARPQAQQTHKVIETINNAPIGVSHLVPQHEHPAKIPLAHISLPAISSLQLNTLVHGDGKLSTHVATLGSRSDINEMNKNTLKPHEAETEGELGTHVVTLGLRSDITGIDKDTTKLHEQKSEYKVGAHLTSLGSHNAQSESKLGAHVVTYRSRGNTNGIDRVTLGSKHTIKNNKRLERKNIIGRPLLTTRKVLKSRTPKLIPKAGMDKATLETEYTSRNPKNLRRKKINSNFKRKKHKNNNYELNRRS